MLHKDHSKRITKGQTRKLKAHAWCRDINWSDVYSKKIKPPFEPNKFKSNFDPEYVRESSTI